MPRATNVFAMPSVHRYGLIQSAVLCGILLLVHAAVGHFQARCFIDVTCLMLFILTCFCYCSTLICLHCKALPSSLVGGAIEIQLID